jgi:predicted PurR-regulated permease PerM
VAILPSSRSSFFGPLIFTLFVGLVLLLPVSLVLNVVARESGAAMRYLSGLHDNGIPVPSWLTQLPVLGEHAVSWWQINLSDPKSAGQWLDSLKTLGSWVPALGGELLNRIFVFFFMLLALFFMYRDGDWVGDRFLHTTDRFLGDPDERLSGKMLTAVRGNKWHNPLVALVEGSLVGFGYVMAGVPNPLLLTLLTIAFAMVPFGGWVMFTIAAILLLFNGGSFVSAAFVFGFGAAVMLIGDNYVWPTLVGDAARLPFLLAFIGVFGGLQTFGPIGIFLGPVIMAALLTIWRDWLSRELA